MADVIDCETALKTWAEAARAFMLAPIENLDLNVRTWHALDAADLLLRNTPGMAEFNPVAAEWLAADAAWATMCAETDDDHVDSPAYLKANVRIIKAAEALERECVRLGFIERLLGF